ncbi:MULTISPECIES: XRE family transcriptional regulator [Stenotrophomonas]|uniref:XRE family transcriptional regulator n=1 Tax=Stenotrophomonas TaxID=40323 RepID=UPI000871E68B|nr:MULTISPECIES: XRE family transcriptional regulator [Stenotrophomonas]OEZ01688.1 Fis family transcriptional regulator [Stenotrophomonas sp. BIIR7]
MSRNKHVGSSFDDFLESEGLLEESEALAVKRVIAWQVAEAMKAGNVSKATLAKRMHTSRSQLDRVLDEADTGLTLDTLSRTATALGYRIKVDLVAPDVVVAKTQVTKRRKSAVGQVA